MKIISTDNTYRVFDDCLRTYNSLPIQAYQLGFRTDSGFFLEKCGDIEIKERKVYGTHRSKIDKVLNTFEQFDRNLGVLLSGEKGIGKTLFVRMLAAEALKKGLPVIVVNRYYTGIDHFLQSIDQEVAVLFD